jgi:peptidoglycan biosynthesis protein MviN/MurJ (putative lipid II flippase)
VIAAAGNIGLNLYLIPRYGLVAAAVTTVFAYVLVHALGFLELKLVVGWVPITRRLVGPTVLGAVVLTCGAVAATWLPTTIPIVIGLTAAVGVSYVLAFGPLVGFTPEEVMIAKDAQRRAGVTIPGLNAVLDRFARS